MKPRQDIAGIVLSNGDIVQVTKYNRQYTVTTIHHDDSPPDCEQGLNKENALSRLADITRQDVLELD